MNSTVAENPVQADSHTEQVIIFKLHNESFGFNISFVNEITELLPLNHVPRSPEFISGVVNYHGRIISIVDFASFFKLPTSEPGPDTRMLILVPTDYQVGFTVDSVCEIAFISEKTEEVNPMDCKDFNNTYIEKVVTAGKNLVNIIDVERVLAELEDHFKEVDIEY